MNGEGVAVGRKGHLTKADLYAAGLSGGPGAAERRCELLKRLGLPERMTTNSLLEVLNTLYNDEELEKLGILAPEGGAE